MLFEDFMFFVSCFRITHLLKKMRANTKDVGVLRTLIDWTLERSGCVFVRAEGRIVCAWDAYDGEGTDRYAEFLKKKSSAARRAGSYREVCPRCDVPVRIDPQAEVSGPGTADILDAAIREDAAD